MIKRLQEEILRVPTLLHDRGSWTSLLIERYPPVIWRMHYELEDGHSILLHKLHNTEGQPALMHSHSWPFAIKVLEGGYEMGIGYSHSRDHPPEPTVTVQVVPGTMYEMLDSSMWHYTKPHRDTEASYSIMLVGPRRRERMALNNDPLSVDQQEHMFEYFKDVQ